MSDVHKVMGWYYRELAKELIKIARMIESEKIDLVGWKKSITEVTYKLIADFETLDGYEERKK